MNPIIHLIFLITILILFSYLWLGFQVVCTLRLSNQYLVSITHLSHVCYMTKQPYLLWSYHHNISTPLSLGLKLRSVFSVGRWLIHCYLLIRDSSCEQSECRNQRKVSGPVVTAAKNWRYLASCITNNIQSGRLGGVVVSVLATGPKGHGYKPGRGKWIFKGDKHPHHAFSWLGSKARGPMS
jgi:hypothetical protein